MTAEKGSWIRQKEQKKKIKYQTIDLFSQRFEDSIVDLRERISDQDGTLHVFIHPLHYLLTKVDSRYAANQQSGGALDKVVGTIRRVSKAKDSNSIEESPISLDERAPRFYFDLVRKLKKKNKDVICIAGLSPTFSIWKDIAKIVKFKGTLLAYTTYLNDPNPTNSRFSHCYTSELVNRFSLIGVEKLRINGLYAMPPERAQMIPTSYENPVTDLAGCVGTFANGLSDVIYSDGLSEQMDIELGKVVWSGPTDI